MPSRMSIRQSSIRSRATRFARSGPRLCSVGRGYLSTLYVLPSCQGRGVGSALHDLALERLRALGFELARLWTLDGNASGRRFYERRGWTLTDETRVVPYPPNPVDVQYAKALDPS